MKLSMRIMLIANTSWYLNNFRARLIKTLKKRGHTIITVAPTDKYTSILKSKADEHHEWPLVGASKNPFKEVFAIKSIWQTANLVRPDVILSYTPKANIYSALACRFLNINIICNVSGLGNVFITGGISRYLVKKLYKFAFAKADKVFFQNQDDKNLFIQSALVKSEKASLLPGSGVNLKFFHPKYNKTTNSDTFRFIFIARMLKEKGLFEYIEAAKILKVQNLPMEFLLLGPIVTTNPTAVSKERIQKLQSQGTIEYLGESDNVRDFLSEIDCVVLPSYREGMPRSLLEASSMGKPVITTDVPGCRDVLDDGISGFLCKTKSASDLARAMLKMYKLPPDKRKAMGRKGRVKMEQEFNEEIVLKAYIEAIANL